LKKLQCLFYGLSNAKNETELAYDISMKSITTFTTILAYAAFFGMPLWVRLASNIQQCNSMIVIGAFMLVYSILMALVESSMNR
jgi:hypothetical protein